MGRRRGSRRLRRGPRSERVGEKKQKKKGKGKAVAEGGVRVWFMYEYGSWERGWASTLESLYSPKWPQPRVNSVRRVVQNAWSQRGGVRQTYPQLPPNCFVNPRGVYAPSFP